LEKLGIVEETMSEEEKGFVIKDKRSFSQETGEPKPEESTQDDKQPAGSEEKTTEAKSQKPQQEMPKGERPAEDIQLPEVNFSTFVFSLSSSALFHFGEMADPATGAKEKNLPMAKHTIDILGMLEEKTRGNLTGDEEQLLKNILYDLRMRYVKERA
jgi:hypothetical protein